MALSLLGITYLIAFLNLPISSVLEVHEFRNFVLFSLGIPQCL